MDDKPCKSTPTKDLEDRIMNPNIPKSEAEWWAKNKIEELQWKITERLSLIAPELEKARKWDESGLIDDSIRVERELYLETIGKAEKWDKVKQLYTLDNPFISIRAVIDSIERDVALEGKGG